MSISPLPGSGFISVLRSVPASSPGAVAAHRALPQDPLNQHLTDGDRSAITAATGADYEPGGGILHPMSMSTDDRSALSRAVGQIAADRADGRLTGDVSAEHLSALFRQHGYQGAAAPRTDGQDHDPGIDLLA